MVRRGWLFPILSLCLSLFGCGSASGFKPLVLGKALASSASSASASLSFGMELSGTYQNSSYSTPTIDPSTNVGTFGNREYLYGNGSDVIAYYPIDVADCSLSSPLWRFTPYSSGFSFGSLASLSDVSLVPYFAVRTVSSISVTSYSCNVYFLFSPGSRSRSLPGGGSVSYSASYLEFQDSRYPWLVYSTLPYGDSVVYPRGSSFLVESDVFFSSNNGFIPMDSSYVSEDYWPYWVRRCIYPNMIASDDYCNLECSVTYNPPSSSSSSGGGGTVVYEYLDIWALISAILTMPFTFFSQAFDVVVFKNTAYAFNVSTIVYSFFIIALLWSVIRLIIGISRK